MTRCAGAAALPTLAGATAGISTNRDAFAPTLEISHRVLLSAAKPATPPKDSSGPHLVSSRQGEFAESRTRISVPPSGVLMSAARTTRLLSAVQPPTSPGF